MDGLDWQAVRSQLHASPLFLPPLIHLSGMLGFSTGRRGCLCCQQGSREVVMLLLLWCPDHDNESLHQRRHGFQHHQHYDPDQQPQKLVSL